MNRSSKHYRMTRSRRHRRNNSIMWTGMSLVIFAIAVILFTALSGKNKGKDNVSGSSSVQTSSISETASSEEQDDRFSSPVGESDMIGSAYFKDAVFVGDSITAGIELYSTISTANVVASTGINLETVMTKQAIKLPSGEKVLMTEAVKSYNPKKIYIMMGTNGIEWMTIPNMISQYEKLFDTLKEQNPQAIFYIQSIPPVTVEKETKMPTFNNAKIVEYNAELLKLASRKKAYFVDVHSALVNDQGALPSDVSTDGVHFNAATYTKWIEYVRTHTARNEEVQ